MPWIRVGRLAGFTFFSSIIFHVSVNTFFPWTVPVDDDHIKDLMASRVIIPMQHFKRFATQVRFKRSLLMSIQFTTVCFSFLFTGYSPRSSRSSRDVRQATRISRAMIRNSIFRSWSRTAPRRASETSSKLTIHRRTAKGHPMWSVYVGQRHLVSSHWAKPP